MAVRKQLLERELNKLGFRKVDAGRNSAGADAGTMQQDSQSSSHPSADGHGDDHAG